MQTATAKKILENFQEKLRPKLYTEPTWWNDDLADNYEGRCRSSVRDFVLGTMKKKVETYGGRMKGSGRHILFTKKDGAELWMTKDNPTIKVTVCLAKKVNGCLVGNSSSMSFMRVVKTKKIKAVGTGGRLKIQEVMSDVLPMLPFQMFKETRLDIDSLELIEKAPDEKFDIGRTSNNKRVLTHFTGAMLFKIDVRKKSVDLMGQKDQYFLFDVDRNDLKLNNLNFFLSRLAGPATSIQEAYGLLKPVEVYEAEKFLKRPCERQGEWFFIPVDGEYKRKTVSSIWGRGRPSNAEAVLQSKGNRPHFVEQLSVEGYVKGKVTHGGHEHKPIMLETWHKAVPNTAVESFKISGAVD